MKMKGLVDGKNRLQCNCMRRKERDTMRRYMYVCVYEERKKVRDREREIKQVTIS